MDVTVTQYISGPHNDSARQGPTIHSTLEDLLAERLAVTTEATEETEAGHSTLSELTWLPLTAGEAQSVLPPHARFEDSLWEMRDPDGNLLGVAVNARNWSGLSDLDSSYEQGADYKALLSEAQEVTDRIEAIGMFIPQDADETTAARQETCTLDHDGNVTGINGSQLASQARNVKLLRGRVAEAKGIIDPYSRD